MSLWKKVLIGICLLVAVAAVGIDHFSQSAPDPCDNSVVSTLTSPNGKTRAVVYNRDCGATTDFVTHVSILSSDEALNGNTKSLFAADSNKGKAPAQRGTGPEIRVKWFSNTRLEIQHHPNVRVKRSSDRFNGVAISYSTYNL